jgi:hypothetical protein
LILLIFRYNDRIAQAPHPTPLEKQEEQEEQEEQERLLVLARLEILIQDITWTMYVSVCRGLFEKDKMVFAATVAVSDFPQCVHPHGHSFVLRRRTSFNLLQRSFNVLSTLFQRSFNSLSILFQFSVNVLSTFFQRSFNVLSIFFQLVGGSFILVSINSRTF